MGDNITITPKVTVQETPKEKRKREARAAQDARNAETRKQQQNQDISSLFKVKKPSENSKVLDKAKKRIAENKTVTPTVDNDEVAATGKRAFGGRATQLEEQEQTALGIIKK